MAEEKKAKRELHRTPKGDLVWPRLNKPDTKFKKEGEFSTKLRVPANDPATQALIAQIDKLAKESLERAVENEKDAKKKKKWETKYLPYEIETDEDDNETGFVLFKFARVASGTSKKTGKEWKITHIPMFDAKGKPMPSKIEPWNGTVAKVSFTFTQYAPTIQVGASVSLSLEAVQILDLKTGGQRDASAYGFGEEDGYGYEEGDEDETGTSGGDEGSDSTDDTPGEEDF